MFFVYNYSANIHYFFEITKDAGLFAIILSSIIGLVG